MCQEFQNLVRAGWWTQVIHCKMLQIVKKLKFLKKSLRKLNVQHLRNIVTETDEDRNGLKEVQLRLQADPGNMELQQEEHLEYQAYRESSYLAEAYLQQKSK